MDVEHGDAVDKDGDERVEWRPLGSKKENGERV